MATGGNEPWCDRVLNVLLGHARTKLNQLNLATTAPITSWAPRGRVLQRYVEPERFYMTIAKTLLNALGLLLTFVGVWVVLRNLPVNENVTDGGDAFTNHAAESAGSEFKIERMRH